MNTLHIGNFPAVLGDILAASVFSILNLVRPTGRYMNTLHRGNLPAALGDIGPDAARIAFIRSTSHWSPTFSTTFSA